MTPAIMALALLPLAEPWVSDTERNAFVRELLERERIVTVVVRINWRELDPLTVPEPGLVMPHVVSRWNPRTQSWEPDPIEATRQQMTSGIENAVFNLQLNRLRFDFTQDGRIDADDIQPFIGATR